MTNDAWRAMHGAGYADDWLDRWCGPTGAPLEPMALRRVYGYPSIVAALDARLSRHVGAVPPRGALVLAGPLVRLYGAHRAGVALGIAIGSKGAWLSSDGIVQLPIETAIKAWT